MKPLVATLIALFFALSSFGQNYQCLQYGPKNYFISSAGYVRGIRIDSIHANGTDTTFYPFHTRRINGNYVTSTPVAPIINDSGASWLGKNVVKHVDGTFVFDNIWDTVFIKTQAHTGDSWIFFDDTSIFSYNATVIAEDTMTVLGSLDSIKKITISAYRRGLINEDDPVNGFKIILSKNNGFAQVFDLYTFPYHRPDTVTFNPPFTYNLRWIDYYLDVVLGNLGTCDLGCSFDTPPDTTNSIFRLFPFYNPRHTEIYDFAADDIYESEFGVWTYGSATGVVTEYTLDSVATKTTTPYNVSYTGSEHNMYINANYSIIPPTFDTTYPLSGHGSIANGDTSFFIDPNVMPEETPGYILHYFPEMATGTTACNQPAQYVFVSYPYYVYNDIAMLPVVDSSAYSIGFGKIRDTHYNPVASSEDTRLIYYLKDTATCGTFVSPLPPAAHVAVNNVSQLDVHISPNPANDHLLITGNNIIDYRVSVYDITGRLIFQSQTNAQKNVLDVNTSSWNEGLYVVLIQNNDGILKREKVEISR